MHTRTVAVVPLRAPGAGKTRLASVLDPQQRAVLAGAMLGDVATALQGSEVDEIVVAAGGRAAVAAATAIGLRVVPDDPRSPDLNAVLTEVTRRVGTDSEVLIVAADLPRLTSEDVGQLLDVDREVVVAPTHEGGTGGLLRRRGVRIGTAFGPGSATAHRELALAAGASVATFDRPGFHHDVDTWTDLVALHEVEVGRATAAVLPTILGRPARAG